MSLSLVWYVSGFKQPWEAYVIGNLAEALKARGVSLRVYAKGGTAHFHVEGVMSWNSLTFFERAKAVLFERKLWHLWGDAPLWWGLVRLRTRTAHTSLSTKVRWRGHPTRLFKGQANEGENRILPTCGQKAAWTDSEHLDEPGPVLIPAWNEDARTRKDILEAWASILAEATDLVEATEERFTQTKIFVVDGSPSGALQAALMTMRGVPVVARDAPLIKEVLGPKGYVAAPANDKPESKSDWKSALLAAASDAGRSCSAAARHYLIENYGAAAAAESLENLYATIGRGKL